MRLDPPLKHSRAYVFGSALSCALVLTLSTLSCVSVNLGKQAVEKSNGVSFTPPGDGFNLLSQTAADGAWQKKSNGNSISYLSSCNDPTDPSLETVARELFADLKNMKTLVNETTNYNGREALNMEVEGTLDGVLTRIHAVVFKKNACLYTISYIGVARSFGEDKARFDDFLRSFKAP